MRAALILIGALLIPTPGSAGPASERMFATDVLNSTESHSTIVYAHDRIGLAQDGLRPIADGTLRLNVEDGAAGARKTSLEMGTADQLRLIGKYSEASGNPVLPIFLESTLGVMSRITGGSPFYIRNRMKEALGAADQISPGKADWAGQSVKTEEIVIKPFATDAKRDRMGAFADMEFRFVMSQAVPGGYVSLSAKSAADASGAFVYQETIELTGIE